MHNVTLLTDSYTAKNPDNSAHSLHLLLLNSNETGGLIGMNVIWSRIIVRYTVEVWKTAP